MTETHLFDGELLYDPDAEHLEAGDSSPFAYIGSGGGTVRGPKLEGELRWSLFEEQSDLVCRARRTGVIETTDGATIELEELGYFGRKDETTSLWRFAGGVRFKTSDERYAWLMEHPAVVESEMDLSTGRGQLSVRALNGRG